MFVFTVYKKENDSLSLVLKRSFDSSTELLTGLSSAFILFGFKDYRYSLYYDEQES